MVVLLNPKTLRSSRLRKQIATILQVMDLTETEKDQMASFMGHTKKTHEEFYRQAMFVIQLLTRLNMYRRLFNRFILFQMTVVMCLHLNVTLFA